MGNSVVAKGVTDEKPTLLAKAAKGGSAY